MKIEQFRSLKEAVNVITKESKSYVFVRHILHPGQEIKLHRHPKANEFLVIDNGWLVVKLGREKRQLNVTGQVTVIRFPKRWKHGLLALSPISYLVLRDAEDDTIYCKR